ncbi:MAG TPA: hypothetical protein PKC72_12315 [Chitinophagaceae bacterium]|nr:hypothetical protein [Chitinophagaceae bacterium]
MKKLIISAGLILGLTSLGMAQTPAVSKTKTDTHPAKMAIAKNTSNTAKATGSTTGKMSATNISKTDAVTDKMKAEKKPVLSTQKANQTTIHKKHHKAVKKAKKAAKPEKKQQ